MVVAVHLQHVGRALVARVHHPVIAVLLQHAQAGVVRRQGELAARHRDDIGVDLDRRDARGRQVAMAEPRGRPRPHAQLHYVEIAFRGRLQEQQPGHLLVDVFEIEGIRIGQPQGALRHPFAADKVHEAVPLFLDDGDRRQRGHGACGSLRRHGGGREVRISLGRCGAQKCHGGRSCGVKSRSEVVGDAPLHWAGRASAWAQLAICRPAPVFPASAARPWVRVGLRACGNAPGTPAQIDSKNELIELFVVLDVNRSGCQNPFTTFPRCPCRNAHVTLYAHRIRPPDRHRPAVLPGHAFQVRPVVR